jgi:hypothetical protein
MSDLKKHLKKLKTETRKQDIETDNVVINHDAAAKYQSRLSLTRIKAKVFSQRTKNFYNSVKGWLFELLNIFSGMIETVLGQVNSYYVLPFKLIMLIFKVSFVVGLLLTVNSPNNVPPTGGLSDFITNYLAFNSLGHQAKIRSSR